MARKPRKDEVWKGIATELGGTVQSGRRGRVKAVRFDTDAWQVILDTYTQSNGETSQTYTRVRTVFRARDDLRFRVYRKSIFSGLGKAFGMQDLEIGMPPVDEAYIVQSNSIGKVQSLLMRREIADPLVTLNAGKLQIRPFKRRALREPGWMELVYEATGVVRDGERLRMMVALLQAVIRHLGKIGTAAGDPVPVEI